MGGYAGTAPHGIDAAGIAAAAPGSRTGSRRAAWAVRAGTCPFCSRSSRAADRSLSGMDDAFAAGDRFLLNQARLLERRLFATCFLGQPAARVVDALRGYQNDDGGFGHALEPDKRCPASLPVDVETAFQALATAGTVDRDMVIRAGDFLARAAEEAGAGRRRAAGLPGHRVLPARRALDRVDLPAWPQPDGRPGRAAVPARRRPSLAIRRRRLLLAAAGVGRPARRCARAQGGARLPRARPGPGPGRAARGCAHVRTWPASPCSTSTRTRPATACRRSTSRRRPPPGGARCSPTPRSTPTSTGCRRTSRPTAAGRSPGSRPARPQYAEWRGIVTLGALRTLTSYGRLTATT